MRIMILIALFMAVFASHAWASCESGTDESIEQFGITWTFDKEYTCGTFANGDYWVLGPVRIIDTEPESVNISGRIMHGSMINPDRSGQAYDSSAYAWMGIEHNAGANVTRYGFADVPCASSFITAVSHEDADSRPRLKKAAILTVLCQEPDEGSFRPAYSGHDKTILYNIDDIDYSYLEELSPVPSTPEINKVEQYFEKPWIDHIAGWTSRFIHPSENMKDYGRDISNQVGIGALMLHLDYSEADDFSTYGTNDKYKEKLLVRYLQLGIDIKGLVDIGIDWPNDGGHQQSRKWPILLAGIILGDHEMKNIGEKSGDYLYENPDEYIHFGEDDQTFYVTKHPLGTEYPGSEEYDVFIQPYKLRGYHGSYTSGEARFTKGSNVVEGIGTNWHDGDDFVMIGANDSEMFSPTGRAYAISEISDHDTIIIEQDYRGYPEDPDGTEYVYDNYIISDLVSYGHARRDKYYDVDEYTKKHAGLPEWGIRHSNYRMLDSVTWGVSYRQCCTANSFAGYVLAALIMMDSSNSRELWNHNALFDYQDRYMHNEIISGNEGSYSRQASGFAEDMWDEYRSQYGCLWTPDDEDDLYSQGHYECAGEQIRCLWQNSTVGTLAMTCTDYPNPTSEDYDPCGLGCGSDNPHCITEEELINMIQKWRDGTFNMNELVDAIGIWRTGC